MTKEEHIKHWSTQVDTDLDCADLLLRAGHLAQGMFWTHLCVEKILKALWIKTQESNTPPFIHNLLKLATDSKIELSGEQFDFLSDMNVFQGKGRYPDYTKSLEATLTVEICEEYFAQSKAMIQWIRENLL